MDVAPCAIQVWSAAFFLDRAAQQAGAAASGRNHTDTKPRCCATPRPTALGILSLGATALGPSRWVTPLLRAGAPLGPGGGRR